MRVLEGRRSRLLVPLLLLAAVFVVANLAFNLQHLALGPETVPDLGGLGESGETGTLDLPWAALRSFFVSLAVVLIALLVAGVLYMWWKGEKGWFPVDEVVGMIVAALAVAVLILALQALQPDLQQEGGEREPGFPDETEESGSLPRAQAASLGLGILGAAVVAVVLGLFLARRLAPVAEEEPEEERRRRAASRLAEALYRLDMGEDVRGTILRCYADMTRLFRDRGVRYGAEVTARELEALAVNRLGVSSEAAIRLRALFEEARYSVHPLEEEARAAATRCLASVREELDRLSSRGAPAWGG